MCVHLSLSIWGGDPPNPPFFSVLEHARVYSTVHVCILVYVFEYMHLSL